MRTHNRFHRTLLVSFTLMVLGMSLLFSMSIDPPRAEAQQPKATPTSAVKVQTTPAPKSKQPASVNIPSHRTGHLAKTTNLDVLVAGGQSDPLAGNYRIVDMDRVVLAYDDPNGNINHKMFSIDANLGNPVPQALQTDFQVTNYAVASGYLSSDAGGATDIVMAAVDTSHKVWLMTSVAANDLGKYTSGGNYVTRSSGQPDSAKGPIAVATGNFGKGYDQPVAVYQDNAAGTLVLQIWDLRGSAAPCSDSGCYNSYSYNFGQSNNVIGLHVATGDFNGDGISEIAVVWGDAMAGVSHLHVFTYDRDNNIIENKDYQWSGNETNLSIATGDFEGDSRDEIAVGWLNTNTWGWLSVFEASGPSLNTLTLKGSVQANFIYDILPKVAAGDFNKDGIDEIVLAGTAGTGSGSGRVSIYTVDATTTPWSLTEQSHTFFDDRGYEAAVAVGDVNQDTVAEIVVTWESGTIHNYNTLQVFQASTDLKSLTAKGMYTEPSLRKKNSTAPAIALGGFDGKSLRVGPPTHRTTPKLLVPVVIVNAPPKHKDTINGTVYDINTQEECSPNASCTYVKFETEQKADSSISTKSIRGFGISYETKSPIAFALELGINVSYGHNFEHSTTTFTSTVSGYNSEANNDDVLIRGEETLDVWEYPIYSDSSDTVQGYLLVQFPQKIDPTCIKDCSGVSLGVINGKALTSSFPVNHEPLNALSYSLNKTTEITSYLNTQDVINHWGVSNSEQWFGWTNVNTDKKKQTNEVNMESQVGFEEMWSLKGHFDASDIRTVETTMESSTSYHVYFHGIQQKYQYAVLPYFYWSSAGALVVDYTVSPESPWWRDTYTQSDPAFNLPWYDESQGADYKLMTREISFDPPAPKVGQPVTITTNVRNYSLVQAQNVPVTLYNGAPASNNEITHFTITTVPPQGSFVYTYRWTPPSQQATLKIYGKIVPTTGEMHVENDIAYATLPIVSGERPAAPTSLSIASADLMFHPAPVMLGVPTYITATVRAKGDTFTNVALEFWDGEPYKTGSVMIGGRLIPMVPRDQSVTDGIRWIPRIGHGQHQIWATLRGATPEDIYNDNRAYRTLYIQPGPNAYFFPFVAK